MIENIKAKHVCKGLFFRLKLNPYFDYKNKQYTFKYSLKLLKRKSCNEEHDGCCDWHMIDDIQDFVDNETLPIVADIENDAIYQLLVVNIQTDFETGITDDWDLEFRKTTVA